MGDDGPVYLLSLDGGGIRGISELVILHEIMKRLQKVAGLTELPKPRDYFHLIGGTSTGGLVAIMLGRIGMTTQEAIECYDSFAKKVFRKSNRRLNRTFREGPLEKLIQSIVAERGLKSTAMINEDGKETGLAFVCSVTQQKKKEPYLFRTYRGNSNHAHNAEIWEAARATTAAPTFFCPMSIKIEASWDLYIDGAVSFNNPSKLVLKEAEYQFGSGRILGFLLSLGTGLKKTDKAVIVTDVESAVQHAVQSSKPPKKQSGALLSRPTLELLKHAKEGLTDPEIAHRELEERFQGVPYAYFRLNLDQGASDIKLYQYKKMNVLREATEKYLKKVEVSAAIDKVVRILHNKEGTRMPLEATTRAYSEANNRDAFHRATENRRTAIASAMFTGRKEILAKMDHHFSERVRSSSPRRRLRIWGMGGVGKTQIALKFRDSYGDRFDRIFWINAANEDSIYESFRTMTDEIFEGGPHSRPEIEHVLRWLAQTKEEWLLIFDNNDSVDVSKYLPEADKGNILFTSRRKDIMPGLNDDQTFAVDVMSETDAVALLLEASRRKKESLDGNDERHVKQIVTELGYLPLAVDQAGSYIYLEECSFGTYLVDFRERRRELLEDASYGQGALENPAVYGTFELSYEALRTRSKEDGRKGRAALNALRILNIFCFYHNENITDQIVGRAAVYKRLDTEFICGEEGSIAPLPLLDCTEAKDWDPKNFKEGITTLRSYSLLKRSIANQEWHTMHILIHSWARDRMSRDTLIFQRRAAREILFFSISRHNRLQDELFASQVLPHMRACLSHGGGETIEWMRRTEQEGKLAWILQGLGMWQDATNYWEEIVADRAQHYDREDWLTITGMWDLAKAYRDAGRLQKSEEIFEEIKTVLPKCPQKVANVKVFDIYIDLAKVYLEQARYEEARGILFVVFDEYRNIGWKSGPFRRAITTLATVVRMAGDAERALGLETFIFQQCLEDEAIGAGHRMTMTAIGNIAALRSEMGLHEKADEMWTEVLDIDEDLRGKEHPITLRSKRNVATGRTNLGKLEEAEGILREVLYVSERVLGSDHLDTLATMDQLAGVLIRRKKPDEAVELWELCLEGRECWLGDEHPLTKRTRQALDRMRGGLTMIVQEDLESDGFLSYGDSNFVSHAERDRYLH